MKELISVVVITYKRPIKILKRALNSVIFQDYENIEIIVVNDCPEDIEGSHAINELIKGYNDHRIILRHHEVNKGANAARNTGLKEAKGVYIAFLDDDDEWSKDKLSKQYSAISQNKKYGIAYSGFFKITKNKKISHYPKVIRKKDSCLKKILEDNYIGATSFSLIRMEAIKYVGGFDEKIKICQEYDLWIRILEYYDSVCVNELLGNYYYSEDSTFKDVDKYLNGCNILIEKNFELYKKYSREWSNKLLNMFVFSCKNYRWKTAFQYKLKAFLVNPFNPRNLTLILILKILLKMN